MTRPPLLSRREQTTWLRSRHSRDFDRRNLADSAWITAYSETIRARSPLLISAPHLDGEVSILSSYKVYLRVASDFKEEFSERTASGSMANALDFRMSLRL
jgi:hypothetical protein